MLAGYSLELVPPCLDCSLSTYLPAMCLASGPIQIGLASLRETGQAYHACTEPSVCLREVQEGLSQEVQTLLWVLHFYTCYKSFGENHITLYVMYISGCA